MPAEPEVTIVAGEPIADDHEQRWCPAVVTLTWPPVIDLPATMIRVSVVAPLRGEMTVDELRSAHVRAAHDVLAAALLSLEAPVGRRTEPNKRSFADPQTK
jgi:hypothetical protein